MNTLPSTRSLRWAPLMVVVAMLAACGGDPPSPCGTIPQQELYVRQTSLLQPCFEDPEGEKLTLTARSSDVVVATVIVLGQAIRIKAVSPGNATVTVTAEDPGGQTAAIDIAVLVPNQAPIARGNMDPIRMLEGGRAVREIDHFFDDPDDQDLVFTAVSGDPGIVGAEILDSIKLLVTGASLGMTTVTVTATDPGGLSASREVDVSVLEPVQLFREDFDEGNGGFFGNFATVTQVQDGFLRVANRYTYYWGWAEKSGVNAVEWEWKATMGQEEDGDETIPGLMAYMASGSSPLIYNLMVGYSPTAEEIWGIGDHDFVMLYWAPGWTTEGQFWGETEAVPSDPGEQFEVNFTNRNGELTATVNSTLIMKVDLIARAWATELSRAILSTLSGGTYVYAAFDWTEMNALPSSDNAWHEGPSEVPAGAFTVKAGVEIPQSVVLNK